MLLTSIGEQMEKKACYETWIFVAALLQVAQGDLREI
jgi:hypothetical protein